MPTIDPQVRARTDGTKGEEEPKSAKCHVRMAHGARRPTSPSAHRGDSQREGAGAGDMSARRLLIRNAARTPRGFKVRRSRTPRNRWCTT